MAFEASGDPSMKTTINSINADNTVFTVIEPSQDDPSRDKFISCRVARQIEISHICKRRYCWIANVLGSRRLRPTLTNKLWKGHSQTFDKLTDDEITANETLKPKLAESHVFSCQQFHVGYKTSSKKGFIETEADQNRSNNNQWGTTCTLPHFLYPSRKGEAKGIYMQKDDVFNDSDGIEIPAVHVI